MSGLAPLRRHHGSLVPTSFERFSDMFDDFFQNNWLPRKSLIAETFKLDVQETDKEYLVEAEMPGVKKEDICISLAEGTLTIAAKKEEEIKEEKKNYIHQERSVSSVQRSIYLADAQAEGIKAKLTDGVLCVAIPKTDKKEKHQTIVIE